jgi:hypothetical protein
LLSLAGRALAFESVYPPGPDTRSYMNKSMTQRTKYVVKDVLTGKVMLCGLGKMV